MTFLPDKKDSGHDRLFAEIDRLKKENQSLREELIAWNKMMVGGGAFSADIEGCKKRIKELTKEFGAQTDNEFLTFKLINMKKFLTMIMIAICLGGCELMDGEGDIVICPPGTNCEGQGGGNCPPGTNCEPE